MEATAQPQITASAPPLSPTARIGAVFARPAGAWAGLERRGQWWVPLLITIVVAVAGMAVIYQRAIVPMSIDQIHRQVENGQIPPEQASHAEQMVTGPAMQWFQIGIQVVAVPIMTLLVSLLPWLVTGFMLGYRFSYRDAFVVTAWAGLISLPATILTYALAWVNQTMQNVHVGFGALLPVTDPPSKLLTGLGMFLDHGIGPFSIWYVAVLGLGAAALAAAPSRRVIPVLAGVWVVLWIVIATIGALFSPGA